MPIGAAITAIPAASNSVRVRGKSKLCPTRIRRAARRSAFRISADSSAFSCVLRDRASIQRTGTPNSFTSALRISGASGGAPYGAARNQHGQAGRARDSRAVSNPFQRDAHSASRRRIRARKPRPAAEDHDRLGAGHVCDGRAAGTVEAADEQRCNYRHRQQQQRGHANHGHQATASGMTRHDGKAGQCHQNRPGRRQDDGFHQRLDPHRGIYQAAIPLWI